MAHRWYGPGDSWPKHRFSWWNEALDRAREAGWHLITFSGHAWGKVVCSRVADEAHQKVVSSTGRGNENHARDLVKLIARCQHLRDDAAPPDFWHARNLLDTAAMLLDAAERCLDAEQGRAKVEELLVLCDDKLQDAELLLRQAIEMETRVRTDIQATYVDARRADYRTEPPYTTEDFVVEAERRLRVAHDEVQAHPPSADRAALMTRTAQLREDAASLRRRAELPPRTSSPRNHQPT